MNISGLTRLRMLFLIVCIVLLWYILSSFKFKDHDSEEPDLTNIIDSVSSSAPVIVTVFYEALCPDSKHFINRQLEPTFSKIGSIMDVRLVPYGKATTSTNADGSLSFSCQHGAIECEGNIIHGCVAENIKETRLQLSLIGCMIRDNVIPKDAFHRCFDEYQVDKNLLPKIQQCYDGLHGKELLKVNGELTGALRPKVSFIPTITLDGSQSKQEEILKDLLGSVCKVATGRGPKPTVCQ